MITTIAFANTYITSHNYNFFLMVLTIKINSQQLTSIYYHLINNNYHVVH